MFLYQRESLLSCHLKIALLLPVGVWLRKIAKGPCRLCPVQTGFQINAIGFDKYSLNLGLDEHRPLMDVFTQSYCYYILHSMHLLAAAKLYNILHLRHH